MPRVKTLVELEMTRLSAENCRKPSWWTQHSNADIVAKWRKEATDQAVLMKEPHIDYVLQELEGYANLRKKMLGVEVREKCVSPRANAYGVPTKIYLPRSDPRVNKLGSVITCQDRCTAVPTTYQHRTSPFELANKSRPSMTVVPLQQKEWRVLPIATNPILKAAFGKFSPKTINRIHTFAGGFMTQTEAEAY
ncbi:unnamed protein product [Rhizoctonia solani]|uniref:Uncharacterized protein n=1 Tax=Rhizoctonia solani TaxID=456999 RepID=A0A8H3CGJ6_9AGAM|nr:unnamed protein product [Rhizoctonia solani]